MRIDVITIFPELFEPFLSTSLVGRAVERGVLEVRVHDLRGFTEDRHRSVDDEPYGGGGGMVMTAPPWLAAVRAVSGTGGTGSAGRGWRILLSPQGTPLDDGRVRALAGRPWIVLLCGRYEGIDERVRLLAVDEEISIGDYVLSGGEVPAMVLVEALSRQLPGVVGLPESVERDSFRRGLLDHPHYTRPPVVEGMAVPEVLLSGNHAEIEGWRRRESLRATLEKRPDLLVDAELSAEEEADLAALGKPSAAAGAGPRAGRRLATPSRNKR